MLDVRFGVRCWMLSAGCWVLDVDGDADVGLGNRSCMSDVEVNVGC